MSPARSLARPGRYSVLVFDWDGTIADSELRIVAAAQCAIDALGLPPRSREEIRAIVGLGMREAFEVLFPKVDLALLDGFTARYRERYLDVMSAPVALFPRVEETLRRLHGEGYRLAVATGKGRRGLERDIAGHGLEGLFVTTRSADDAPSKPHPAMIARALEETGAVPAAAVMVGDTTYDMEMARNAGIAALGVAWGYHPPETLHAEGAHGVAEDYPHLMRLLDDLFAGGTAAA